MDQTRQMPLAQLKGVLDALPSSFPTSKINLNTFQVDPAEVNDYGYTGAVNYALDITLVWKSRSSGIRLSR